MFSLKILDIYFVQNNFFIFPAFQVSALILENTFTSIMDMAGVMFPFLKWFIGGSALKSSKILNHLVRSPWSTIDIIGQVSFSFWINFA